MSPATVDGVSTSSSTTPPAEPSDPGEGRRLPHTALSRVAHDRHGAERTDQEWLDRVWADPTTRVLAIAGTRPEWPEPGESARWRGVDELAAEGWPVDAGGPALRLLLGEQDGVEHLALVVPVSHLDAAPADDPERPRPVLRDLLPALVDDPVAGLVLHAVGMAEWLAATRYCPRCGAGLAPTHAGHVLRCTACGRSQFPRTDPAVIMLITAGEPGTEDERVLLGRNPSWPTGRYSTLAGFVEPGETLEDAVRREVAEETGVRVGEVTYFGNQPWPLPASLMLGFTGRAATTEGAEHIQVDEAEIEDAQWFTRAEIAAGLAAGDLVLPGGISISHALLEHWYGRPLDSSW